MNSEREEHLRRQLEAIVEFEGREHGRMKNEVTNAIFRSHQRRINFLTELLGGEVSIKDLNLAQNPPPTVVAQTPEER